MRPRLAPYLTLFASLLLLAACAPATSDERVDVQQLTGPIGYYPSQAGARWEYLPDGALISDPRVRVQVEGPTVVGPSVLVAWHTRGRAIDTRDYRDYRADGVYLHRVERFGAIFRFDPPMQEFPAPEQMRVGATWSGDSTVLIELDGGKERTSLEVSYVYTIVDRRTVTVPAGEFDVYVIDFTSREFNEDGDVSDELTQQVWFSPSFGEVRTKDGHVLVASNVPREGSDKAP